MPVSVLLACFAPSLSQESKRRDHPPRAEKLKMRRPLLGSASDHDGGTNRVGWALLAFWTSGHSHSLVIGQVLRKRGTDEHSGTGCPLPAQASRTVFL